jgi:hypothetical protein
MPRRCPTLPRCLRWRRVRSRPAPHACRAASTARSFAPMFFSLVSSFFQDSAPPSSSSRRLFAVTRSHQHACLLTCWPAHSLAGTIACLGASLRGAGLSRVEQRRHRRRYCSLLLLVVALRCCSSSLMLVAAGRFSAAAGRLGFEPWFPLLLASVIIFAFSSPPHPLRCYARLGAARGAARRLAPGARHVRVRVGRASAGGQARDARALCAAARKRALTQTHPPPRARTRRRRRRRRRYEPATSQPPPGPPPTSASASASASAASVLAAPTAAAYQRPPLWLVPAGPRPKGAAAAREVAVRRRRLVCGGGGGGVCTPHFSTRY